MPLTEALGRLQISSFQLAITENLCSSGGGIWEKQTREASQSHGRDREPPCVHRLSTSF
jgi:hypothetical protein